MIRTVTGFRVVLRGDKIAIEATPESILEIHQPMVRDYSTSGGHLPGNVLLEGPEKTVTKKWQGYPPENLHVLGKSMPALPEVSVPRFTGKAKYASRVWFPDLLQAKFLTCPHPHARIRMWIHPKRRRCRASRTSSPTKTP